MAGHCNKFISLFYNVLSLVTGVAEWRGHCGAGAIKSPFFCEEVCTVWSVPFCCAVCNTFLSLTGHDAGSRPVKQILQEATVKTKEMWAWGRKCKFISIVTPEAHGERNLGHGSRISQQARACRTHRRCWEPIGKASSDLNSNHPTAKKKKN